jgi:hypothetical protein
MAEFTRSTSLKLEVFRSRWSEEDLARVAELLRSHTGAVQISVVTGDGEDHLRTEDPEFFRSSDLPPSIQSVEMETQGTVRCAIKIALPNADDDAMAGDPAKAELSSASRPAVTTLFRDLEKEFRARSLVGARLIKFFHGLGGLVVVFIAVSTVLLGLYATVIGYLADHALWIEKPRGTVIAIIGAGTTLALAAPLTGRGLRVISTSLPLVEFGGRLSRSNRFNRAALVWVFVFVLLPLIVNLIAGIILLFAQ